MTLTTLITPWYRRSSPLIARGSSEPGSVDPTRILDFESSAMEHLVHRSRTLARSGDTLAVLEQAHGFIRDEIRPRYALAENTPVSRTLARGFGSCSQRLAVLEGVARSIGVPTRVRALFVDRSFWYPRFPGIGWLLPENIVLAWPEFDIEGWQPASELFGSIGCRGGGAFTNRGSETLFEAVGRCAVDWDGATVGGPYDLSRFIRADYGYFASRDDVFAELGQTLCLPSRLVADPVFRRISA